eukprot:scaffold80587_cov18-Tisochrysis_lutea.AAC.2
MDRAYNQRQHLANWEKTAASRAGAKQRLMANIYISAVPGSQGDKAHNQGNGIMLSCVSKQLGVFKVSKREQSLPLHPLSQHAFPGLAS